MTTVVALAWLVYGCARLWYACVDVHRESMGRLG